LSHRISASKSRFAPWTGIDPERRNALLLIGGIALVVLFALGLIAYGYYSERIEPNRRPVVQVGHRKFRYSYVEDRLVADFVSGQITRDKLADGISASIANIEKEEVTRQAAASQGIKISRQEMDDAIRSKLGVPKTEERQAIAGPLKGELARLHLTLPEYEDRLRANLLEDRLRNSFREAIPAQTQQADLLIIQTDTQEKAQQALDRIKGGDNPATVAFDLSTHSSKSKGGVLGWTPRDAIAPDLADAAFKQTGFTDILSNKDGFFIFETKAIETRDTTDDQKDAIVNFKFSSLIQETRDRIGSKYNLTTAQAQKLVAALSGSGG
jgi:parvulin-like peptidyl-prolyl isomerase